jgi:MYXO-CTERM domain-containing protein
MTSGDGGWSWEIRVAEGAPEEVLGGGWLAGERVALAAGEAGLLLSDDGVAWWRAGDLPEQLRVSAVAPSPSGALALAGGAAIFRTEDGGDQWAEVLSLPGDEVVAAAWRDEARVCLASREGRVLCSADGGLSWAERAQLQGAGALAWSGDDLLVGGEQGLWRLTGEAAPEALGLAEPVRALAAWDDGLVLAASDDQGPWRSTDGGEAFALCREGVAPPDTFNPIDGHYFGFARGPDGALFLASWEGLYRSEDGGEGWARLPLFGPRFHLGVALGELDGAPAVLMASYGGGSLAAAALEGGGWRLLGAGSLAVHLRGVAASPGFPAGGQAWIAERGNLWVSADGAESWLDVTDGGPLGDIDEVALDPEGGVALAGGRLEEILELARSEDAGESFERPALPLERGQVTALALSPGGGRMAAAVREGADVALLLAEDGGDWAIAAWLDEAPLDLAFSGEEDLWIAGPGGLLLAEGEAPPRLSAFEGRRVEAVTAADGLVFAALAEGVYREAGNGWEPLPWRPGGAVLSLAASPQVASDGLLAAAATDGAWVSDDGGERWALASNRALLDVTTTQWTFDGDWTVGGAGWAQLGSAATAGAAGGVARLRFYGDQARLVALAGEGQGAVEVCLDDGPWVAVPLDGSAADWCGAAEAGWHTLSVRAAALPVQLEAAEVSAGDGLAAGVCEEGWQAPPGGCGCAGGPAAPGWLALLGPLLAVTRRRRRA